MALSWYVSCTWLRLISISFCILAVNDFRLRYYWHKWHLWKSDEHPWTIFIKSATNICACINTIEFLRHKYDALETNRIDLVSPCRKLNNFQGPRSICYQVKCKLTYLYKVFYISNEMMVNILYFKHATRPAKPEMSYGMNDNFTSTKKWDWITHTHSDFHDGVFFTTIERQM